MSDKGGLLLSYFIMFIKNMANVSGQISVCTVEDDQLFVILNEFYVVQCKQKKPTTEDFASFKGMLEMKEGRRMVKIDPSNGIVYMSYNGEKSAIVSDQMHICFELSSFKGDDGRKKYNNHKAIEFAAKHYGTSI